MLSPLERLPVELLQSIFLYSFNFALPQCSHRLYSTLSSKHVKMELVTRAFCNRVRLGTGPDALIYSLSEVDRELGGQYKSLQSGLLHLKWMTRDFFKECIDKFLVRTAAREFGARLTKDGVEGPLPTMAEYRMLVEDGHLCGNTCLLSSGVQCTEWYDGLTLCKLRTLKRKLRDGRVLSLQMNRLDIGFNVETLNSTPSDRPSHSDRAIMSCKSWISLKTGLPSRLLHGPWTMEKCEFLEMLVKMDFRVDWSHSTLWEVAETGLEDAIREENMRAIRLLVSPVRLPGFERQGEEDSEGEEELEHSNTVLKTAVPSTSNPIRWRIRVIPTTSHLRLAVIKCDCPPDIVYHLFRGSSRINTEDSELVGWAVEKRKQGDWRGKWLLKLLRKTWMWCPSV